MTVVENEPRITPDESSVYLLQEPEDPTITVHGTNGRPLVTIHLNTSELTYGPGYTPDDAARAFWSALTFWNTLGPVTTDDAPHNERLTLLAEQLCRSYTRGAALSDLDKSAPEEAETHRTAAKHLLRWLKQAPDHEVKAAFDHGWKTGRASALEHPPHEER
jgi:hypothetical protein